MLPWRLLDSLKFDQGSELSLFQRGGEFSIRVGTTELMTSRVHGSEERLGELGCAAIGNRLDASVLVGGLGMGFTLAAVLREVGPDARVIVAELFPEVVRWNREYFREIARDPLADTRVQVFEGDVMKLIEGSSSAFDLILLDVDNGPSALTASSNERIYSPRGLEQIRVALRERGVLAVWSEAASPQFCARLRKAGFAAREIGVRGTGKKGSHYVVWVAVKE